MSTQDEIDSAMVDARANLAADLTLAIDVPALQIGDSGTR